MATAMTGVGKSIDSSTIGLFGSHRVSPVRVSLSPTTAAMSPAEIDSISSRLLACMRSEAADALLLLARGVVDAGARS